MDMKFKLGLSETNSFVHSGFTYKRNTPLSTIAREEGDSPFFDTFHRTIANLFIWKCGVASACIF